MPWRLSCILLAILYLNGFTHAQQSYSADFWSRWNANRNSDIEFDKEPVETDGPSGMGLPFSDDEDFGESGSGSGSGMGEVDIDPEGPNERPRPYDFDKTTSVKTTTFTPTTTTSRPLTPCEKMRQASRQLVGRFVPRCLPNGDFDSLQCHGHPGTADCWCTDLEGREIPGTLMEAPNFPNCEEGYNLPSCVHQMVKHVRSKLVGTFRPKCAVDGQFDRVQCHGSMCYCVDESTGQKVMGTEVHIPDTPNCDDDAEVSVPEVTPKIIMPDHKESSENEDDDIDIDNDTIQPELVFPKDPEDTIDLDTDITEKHDSAEVEDKFEEDNRSETGSEPELGNADGQEGHHNGKMEKASEIMTQPGILAGIIGGSVVLLLCLVLLVMFIIYRMRKKDEGSYPLDEPRKTQNYNYVRAPDKEFYA